MFFPGKLPQCFVGNDIITKTAMKLYEKGYWDATMLLIKASDKIVELPELDITELVISGYEEEWILNILSNLLVHAIPLEGTVKETQTPLALAVQNNMEKVALHLLKNGANPGTSQGMQEPVIHMTLNWAIIGSRMYHFHMMV